MFTSFINNTSGERAKSSLKQMFTSDISDIWSIRKNTKNPIVKIRELTTRQSRKYKA